MMTRYDSKCFLIGGIRVGVDATEQEILKRAKDKMKRAGLSASTLHFRLYKKSVDARRRDDVRFECTVLAEVAEGERLPSDDALQKIGARRFLDEPLDLQTGNTPLGAPPLVVGMGPAGLFSALLLAEAGYAPILIDRGDSVEERARSVSHFRLTGELDTESNIQFGAGGAGTFSDGKLVTRIHDPKCSHVLRTLVRYGAPREVLTQAKPHVGTDLLRVVVSNILQQIERLGGKVIYRCRMDDFCMHSDGTVTVKTTQGDLHCGAMILAIGHSSRDTYERLIEKGFAMEQKPISVGVRV